MNKSSIRIINLGSGSKGNSSLISYQGKTLLVDCGFSCRQIILRLTEQDINPQTVCGILITHEHGDHIKGAAKCCRDFDAPVLATAGTLNGGRLAGLQNRAVVYGEAVTHEGFIITPIKVSHDTKEPCAFLVEVGGMRAFFCTDLGDFEGLDFELLKNLDYLYVEANHCEVLLRTGSYPYFLKKKISGSGGHLNNDQCGELIKIIAAGSPHLKGIMLAHLSNENNDAEVAMSSVKNRTGELDGVRWLMARQEVGVVLK